MSLKRRFRVGGKRTEHVSFYYFQGPEVASGYRVGLDSRASGVHMVTILPSGGLDIELVSSQSQSEAETYSQNAISWSPSLLPRFNPTPSRKGKVYGLPHLPGFVSVSGGTASSYSWSSLGDCTMRHTKRMYVETHKDNKVVHINTGLSTKLRTLPGHRCT